MAKVFLSCRVEPHVLLHLDALASANKVTRTEALVRCIMAIEAGDDLEEHDDGSIGEPTPVEDRGDGTFVEYDEPPKPQKPSMTLRRKR